MAYHHDKLVINQRVDIELKTNNPAAQPGVAAFVA